MNYEYYFFAIWWRALITSSIASVCEINMAEPKKKDSILQRNVLELADRNSKEVSCTGELLGHGLKYTLRLVWKENLR